MSCPGRRPPMRARAVRPVSAVAVVPVTRRELEKDDVVEYSTVIREGRSTWAQTIAESSPSGPAATPASINGRLRSDVTMPGACANASWREAALHARPLARRSMKRRLFTTSENVLQSELNDAAVFRGCDLTERRGADDPVGLAEARLVPDVEALDTH